MREKLIAYVHQLFRDAPKNQHNQDLEAEILQNSLDRYDDLVSRGVPAESAYSQAVDSIGDVRQLWERGYTPQTRTGKSHTGLIVGLVCGAVVLLLVLSLGLGSLLPYRGSFGGRDPEDRLEEWADDLEDRADHWANGIEEEVEQWVEKIDDEYGFSVLLPNSTFGYPDSERYTVGSAEIPVEDGPLSLQISWIAGDVTVEAWDKDVISIAETETGETRTQVHWLLENGSLNIMYAASGKHTALPSKDLTVKLPVSVAEKLRHVGIDGTSQDVELSGLMMDQLFFYSVSGGFRFSGKAERLSLETTSGEVRLDLDKTPDEIKFDSVSGDLTISMPAGRRFEVDWDTVSGDFDCEFPGEHRDDEWIFNPEENYALESDFEFETVSGNVTIREK